LVQPAEQGLASELLELQGRTEERPDVLLVILGSQLKTSDIRRSRQGDSFRPLQTLLDSAQTFTVLPYVLHQVKDLTAEGSQEVTAELEEVAGDAKVVRCHGMEELHEAVQQASDGPTVLLMSTTVDPELKGTPAGIAAELQQVEAAHAAVDALQKKQVTMYAVQPQLEEVPGEPLQARRRRLAAAGVAVKADVGVCGQLCQTQVKWLEGIMALFILTIAAMAGMCCLNMLDTPTRFESPKESGRNN